MRAIPVAEVCFSGLFSGDYFFGEDLFAGDIVLASTGKPETLQLPLAGDAPDLLALSSIVAILPGPTGVIGLDLSLAE